jgi:hypothetical protein
VARDFNGSTLNKPIQRKTREIRRVATISIEVISAIRKAVSSEVGQRAADSVKRALSALIREKSAQAF